VQARRVAVDVAEEGLLARVDHPHRAAGVEREHAGVDLHREVLAAAEGAAHARERQPHLLGGQVEAGGDLALIRVQPLRRDEQVDAAVLAGDREAGLGAEEGLVLHADLVVAADDHVRLRAGRLHVAVHDAHVLEPVATGVQQRRLHRRVDGAVHVRDRLRRLVADLDERRRAACGLRMVGGDDRDRLALVADPVPRQHGLIGQLEPVGLDAWDVLVGEDGEHARDGERAREVDRVDARGRMRAAQGRAPQRAVAPQVRRVRELAARLERAVRSPRVGADAVAHAGRRDDGHRAFAASRTASMIFS
jgi:hypothetical protein